MQENQQIMVLETKMLMKLSIKIQTRWTSRDTMHNNKQSLVLQEVIKLALLISQIMLDTIGKKLLQFYLSWRVWGESKILLEILQRPSKRSRILEIHLKLSPLIDTLGLALLHWNQLEWWCSKDLHQVALFQTSTR